MQTDVHTKKLRKHCRVCFTAQVSLENPIITRLKIIYAKYSMLSKTCKMRKRLNANLNVYCTKIEFQIEDYPSSICQRDK